MKSDGTVAAWGDNGYGTVAIARVLDKHVYLSTLSNLKNG
ncbi:hypothetical protein ACT8ZS_22005 [Paenibacillus sp. M.A.Huq-84]